MSGAPGYFLGMVYPTWDGIIALVVGGFAVRIYRRQAKIAKTQADIANQQKDMLAQQVRQGSFEIRYKIYEETTAYVDTALRMGADITHNDRQRFGRTIEKARFLFPHNTWEQLALVRQSSEDHIGADDNLRDRRRRRLNTEGAERDAANAAGALEEYRNKLSSIFDEMRLSHGESMLGRGFC